LVTNDPLSAALADKNLPKISNLDIKIGNGKYDAKVRLYLPHNFNERNKYPLLVNVYAGPNSQQVNRIIKTSNSSLNYISSPSLGERHV